MLENEEIRLRTVEPEDLEILLRWENDSENWKVSETLVPFSKKLMTEYIYSAQDLLRTQQIRFIIEDKKKKIRLGCIDLFEYTPIHRRAGVGVLIDKNHRKIGVAKQALQILEKYSFKILNLHQLYCSIYAGNKASIRLFTQAGFEHSGTKKEWANFNGVWEDELFFQKILK